MCENETVGKSGRKSSFESFISVGSFAWIFKGRNFFRGLFFSTRTFKSIIKNIKKMCAIELTATDLQLKLSHLKDQTSFNVKNLTDILQKLVNPPT